MCTPIKEKLKGSSGIRYPIKYNKIHRANPQLCVYHNCISSIKYITPIINGSVFDIFLKHKVFYITYFIEYINYYSLIHFNFLYLF